MNRLRLLLGFMLLVAPTSIARSQTPTERAVRAVVDSFFQFVEREQWDSATTLVDIARFEPYFKQVVGNARTALPPPQTTIEEIMARDSTMPRAVAEWELAQMKKFAARTPGFGDMSHEFAGVHSQADLFALTPKEAAARWLEAQDTRTQAREAWRMSGCPLSTVPQIPAKHPTVLAVAIENDSTAYVVHSSAEILPRDMGIFSHEQVMPLHRIGAQWRIEPRIDLLRLGAVGFGFSDCPKTRR